MIIHDVTATVHAGMHVYPGDPEVVVEKVADVGFGAVANVSRICMGTHTGTHVDPPSHILPGGQTADGLPLDVLIGPAVVVSTDRPEITDRFVDKAVPKGTVRVVFKTAHTRHAGAGQQHTHLSADAASRLVALGVRLVGMDSLSVDADGNGTLPAHGILLGGGVVVVEGLELGGVAPGRYELICLPLKLRGADGAPARVVLLEAGGQASPEVRPHV